MIGVYCGVHHILVVGPDSQRKERLLAALAGAGYGVESSVEGATFGARRNRGWYLVVVLGDVSAVSPLSGCTDPIMVVPNETDDERILSLISAPPQSSRTTAALRYDDTVVRELLGTSPDHISFKDLNGRFTRISASLVPVFGLERPEDAIGKSDFDFYPKERARAFFEEEQRMIRGGPPVINRRADYVNQDGSVVHGLVTKMPLRDEDGTVIGTYGVSRNVTELLEAEDRIRSLLEEKEILLREIHHRVKNDLSLIRSLLLLEASQMAREEVAAPLREAASRVAVMARTYDQINLRGNPNSVSIRPLIEELFRECPEATADRVSRRTRIDDIEVPPRVAVALGIILNELCTNAMKHAFEGIDEPCLTIAVRQCDEGRLSVRFADNGHGFAPAVLAGSKRGHGLSIVEALVEQHGGTFGVANNQGAVIEFGLDLE